LLIIIIHFVLWWGGIISNGALKMLVIKWCNYNETKKIYNVEKSVKVSRKWVQQLLVIVCFFGTINIIMMSSCWNFHKL